MTPEGKLTADVKKLLHSFGAKLWHFKVHGGPAQRAGIPDIVGCLGGKFFAIELKAGGNETSLRQDIEIKRIKEAGGSAFVCRSLGDVKEAISNVLGIS